MLGHPKIPSDRGLEYIIKKIMKAKKKSKEEISFEKSSGNIFEDLGFSNPQEAEAKSKLAIEIFLIIKERGLTQEEAAKIMGTDQPHVSDIMRGKISRFTIDRLMKFLVALGKNVEIKIKPVSSKKRQPRIYVSGERNKRPSAPMAAKSKNSGFY